MAVHFEDLSGEAGLKHLDEYLLTRSYISGYQASRDDLAVYLALEEAPSSKYVNAARWYSHITALLGSSFPGKSAGVKIAGSGATSSTRDISASAAAPPTPEAAAEDSAGPPAVEDDDDDDLDLFGEETEEEKAASAEREAQRKASGKKKESGKSSVLMDVKPWDDETDMKKLEEAVRSINLEGLLWGASKLVPVGYGIKKLQIMMTIVDDLVSPDNLIEDFLTVEPCNEYIQSCDIAAFNKICKFPSLVLCSHASTSTGLKGCLGSLALLGVNFLCGALPGIMRWRCSVRCVHWRKGLTVKAHVVSFLQKLEESYFRLNKSCQVREGCPRILHGFDYYYLTSSMRTVILSTTMRGVSTVERNPNGGKSSVVQYSFVSMPLKPSRYAKEFIDEFCDK